MKKFTILCIIVFMPLMLFAADTKTTALTENTAPVGTDIMYMVDDPGGTPLSQKMTLTNLFDLIDTSAKLAAIVTNETGTSLLVYNTSPTLVTPLLGTPTSGTLTNCTGLPISSGVSGLAAGVASWLATPSSANLITAVTDETGTGLLVFATSPTFTTPILGTPTSGTLTNCTGLPVGSITGLGANVAAWLATASSANLIAAVTDETGTGALVFANSPTLVTPALGTPASGVATNLTGTAAGLTAGNVTTNANLTGEVTSVGNAATIADSVTVTGWVLGTSSATQITSPTLITDLIDTTGAADMDYGSADVTDHTFTSDGGVSIIDGSYTFPDADGAASAVGELQYDNTITGLDDGGLTFYDDDEVQTLVGLDSSEVLGAGDDLKVVQYNWNAGAGFWNLVSPASGDMTKAVYDSGNSGGVDQITSIDSTSATDFVLLTDTAVGTDTVKTDGALTYAATTGTLGATEFSGGGANLTAVNAATVTVVDSTDATSSIAMVDSATGDLAIKTDGGLTYDATSGTLSPTILSTANNIKAEPKHLMFNVFDPLSAQTLDSQICLWPVTPAALTVTKIVVTLDAAGNEVAGDLKWADAFIGFANATVINTFDTTSGVLSDDSITAGTVAAGKAVYIQFDSAPHTDITQMSVDVTFDYD